MKSDSESEKTSLSRSDRSREKLLDASEHIIATKGIEALTLTEVQKFAEQKNKSAIGYHFGSRDGLIEAVVRRHTDRMAERRKARLNKVEGSLDDLSRLDLIDLLISPIMDGVFDSPNSYEARCLQQFGSRPELVDVMVAAASHSNSATIRALLLSHMDHLPPSLRASRIDYAMILVVTLLAQFEACRDMGIPSALSTEVVRRDLLQVACAIIECPVSSDDVRTEFWATRYTRTFRFEELSTSDSDGTSSSV